MTKLSDEQQKKLDQLIRARYEKDPAKYDDGLVASDATLSDDFDGEVITAQMVRIARSALGLSLRIAGRRLKKARIPQRDNGTTAAARVDNHSEPARMVEILALVDKLSDAGRAYLKAILCFALAFVLFGCNEPADNINAAVETEQKAAASEQKPAASEQPADTTEVPPPTRPGDLVFSGADGKELGRLILGGRNGKIEFQGQIDKSAQVFFEYVYKVYYKPFCANLTFQPVNAETAKQINEVIKEKEKVKK